MRFLTLYGVLNLALIPAVGLFATTTGTAANGETLTTETYAATLRRFVTPEGRVRYAALKASPTDLDAFLASIGTLDPAAVRRWAETDRIAFWINAYNAITLKTIINHYPIHRSGLASILFPENSIRQIPNAWSARSWRVMGEKRSLDDIEHEVLRKQFQEPRVHMALVCAAKGCPPLRDEPYSGPRLKDQLDDQTRRYLASPAGSRVLDGGNAVAVSAIFQWFSADFAAVGGVRAFLSRYSPPETVARLATNSVRMTFLDYDWTLNETHGDYDRK